VPAVRDLPEIFLDILGPVLILVAAGAIAGRRLGISPEPLAKVAYWIIGPAFIFDSLANAGLASDELGRLALASFLAFVASALAATALAARLPRDRRAAIVTTGAWGNTGNFGLAIVTFTFDEAALPYAAVCLVVVNTSGLILGVASAHGGWRGVVQAFTRPMTVVVLPALLVNFTDTDVPLIVERPIGLLAGAIIPVMLITLGIQLGQMSRPRLDLDVARSLVAKLAVQPLAAIGAVTLLGISGTPGGAVVLQAAMPAAVFTAILAIEQRTRPDETATIVMAGTLASVVTLPLVILYVR
jgi:malate permease and related proteins